MTINWSTWAEANHQFPAEFQGYSLGSDVSIIFIRLDGPGGGPELHRHPYSETFILRRGTMIFSDGMTTIEASAGRIVVVPRGRPHRFTAKTGPVEMIDIHASPKFITEWLLTPTDVTRTRPFRSGDGPPTDFCSRAAQLPST